MTAGYFGYSGEFSPFPVPDWKDGGHFRPDYRANMPQIPANFSELDVRTRKELIAQRGKYTKSLLGTFYQYLAREFLRGDTLHEGKGVQYARARGGQEFEYLPDIIRSIGGRGHNKVAEEHVEVKTRSARNRILIPPDQTAKYAATLYDGEFEGMPVSRIMNVLFTYYPRQDGQVFKKSKTSSKTYRNPNLLPMGELSGYQLTEYLAQNTNECLIVPLNLYLLLMRTGDEQLKGSDKQDFKEIGGYPPYFVRDMAVNRALYTRLRSVGVSLDELVAKDQSSFEKNARRFELSPKEQLVSLELQRLRVRRFELPKAFYAVHGDSSYPVKPFAITEYYLDDADNRRWIKHLRANFDVIMKQSGLQNYAEKQPEHTALETSEADGDSSHPFG